MGKVVNLGRWKKRRTKEPRRKLPWQWPATIVLGALVAVLAYDPEVGSPPGKPPSATLKLSAPQQLEPTHRTPFRTCSANADNCVVDGDTFRFEGETIRVADIDAPETKQAKCIDERTLGALAKTRLRELLNGGTFDLAAWPEREEDQYGRKLRVVTRNGQSLGMQLVSEGLARPWTGARQPWC